MSSVLSNTTYLALFFDWNISKSRLSTPLSVVTSPVVVESIADLRTCTLGRSTSFLASFLVCFFSCSEVFNGCAFSNSFSDLSKAASLFCKFRSCVSRFLRIALMSKISSDVRSVPSLRTGLVLEGNLALMLSRISRSLSRALRVAVKLVPLASLILCSSARIICATSSLP